MISQVRGTLIEKTPTTIVVETGGIGFLIHIPLSSYNVLSEVGETVLILTHLHAREDALQLYGFATSEERDLFQLLIGVSGIGPKSAQGILSGIAVDEFKRAVRSQDVTMITSAPGIGKKTAERLILELREKIGEDPGHVSTPAAMPTTPIGKEAVLALISLGYKRNRAQELVDKILRDDPSMSVEDVIRRVLRQT